MDDEEYAEMFMEVSEEALNEELQQYSLIDTPITPPKYTRTLNARIVRDDEIMKVKLKHQPFDRENILE